LVLFLFFPFMENRSIPRTWLIISYQRLKFLNPTHPFTNLRTNIQSTITVTVLPQPSLWSRFIGLYISPTLKYAEVDGTSLRTPFCGHLL
jgi:hypothetical protein